MQQELKIPSLAEIKDCITELSKTIYCTPVYPWDSPLKTSLFGENTKVFFKLELFQKTGTFKLRGALTSLSLLSKQERQRGIVAGTAGNHGIAVAFAAKMMGINAKIIVPKTINKLRLKRLKDYSPEIIFVNDVAEIIDEMNKVAKDEQRTIIHPFESFGITLGTATLVLEFFSKVPELDIVIVPIGGGGLASGVAYALKQTKESCKVYGIEPSGANSMNISFKTGKTVVLKGGAKSIADSLCTPKTEPYSLNICKKYLDDVFTVEDAQIVLAMRFLLEELKLFVEGAGATATAGLLGPLKEVCAGKNVGVIVSGSNIDIDTFFNIVAGDLPFDLHNKDEGL